MLSVLVRHKKSRREVLFAAENIEFVPRPSPADEPDGGDPGLLINKGNGEGTHLSFSSGPGYDRDVFVMNDAGSTVARYNL